MRCTGSKRCNCPRELGVGLARRIRTREGPASCVRMGEETPAQLSAARLLAAHLSNGRSGRPARESALFRFGSPQGPVVYVLLRLDLVVKGVIVPGSLSLAPRIVPGGKVSFESRTQLFLDLGVGDVAADVVAARRLKSPCAAHRRTLLGQRSGRSTRIREPRPISIRT